MRTVAFIFARGGSRGVKRKNLRLCAGKPLLVHAIEAARAATLVDTVYVSTDDGEIGSLAAKHGAGVIWRPKELCADDSPEWLSWRHAVDTYGLGMGGIFVSVPCTAPLRLPEDIDNCIRALATPGTDAVMCVTPARRNPRFNMVEMDEDGLVYLFDNDDGIVSTRQQARAAFDVTTVCYAARPQFVLDSPHIWNGEVRGVIVPKERALDIDDEMDLRIADFLMRERERGEVAW